jgi:hypothetical protein
MELAGCTSACDADAEEDCMKRCAQREKECRAKPVPALNTGVFAGKVVGNSRMECVSASFDPQDYNWFAFRNLCPEAIKVQYIQPGQFEGRGCTVPTGSLCRTGLTRRDLDQAQARGGMKWAICDAGHVARGPSGELYRYSDSTFYCIKEPDSMR